MSLGLASLLLMAVEEQRPPPYVKEAMRHRLLSLLLFLFLSGCLVRPAPETQEGRLQAAIRIAPENEHGYVRLADLYRSERRFEDALSVLEIGHQRVPDSSLIRRLQANLLAARNVPQALRVYQVLLEETPDDEDLRLDYAQLLVRAGQRPEARAQLERLQESGSEQANVFLLYGLLNLQEDRLGLAQEALVEAVRLDEENPEAWAELGRLWERQGEWGRAQESLRRAVELAPESEEFLRRFITAQERLLDPKDPDAVLQLGHTLEHLRELAPERAWTQAHYGEFLHRTGRPEEAEAEFRKALEASPQYAWGWFRLGGLLLEQGRPEEAKQALETGLQEEPETPWALQQLALADEQLGRLDEARQRYEALLQQEASLPVLRRLLELHWAELRFDAIQSTLEQGVELFPKVPALRLELAQFLDRRGRYEAARTAFEALPRSGARADFFIQLGRLSRLADDLPQAELDFRQALQLDPKAQLARMQLIELFRQEERPLALETELTTFLQQEPDSEWGALQQAQWLRKSGPAAAFSAYVAATAPRFPDSLSLQLLEVERLRAQQQEAQALVLLQTLQEQAPQNEDLFNELAVLQFNQGNPDAAKQALLRSLELSGSNLWPLMQLVLQLPEAQQQAWFGHQVEVRQAWALLIQNLPEPVFPEALDPPAQQGLAVLHHALQQTALPENTPVAGTAPWFQFAEAVRLEKQPAEAATAYDQLLQHPALPEALRPWVQARAAMVLERSEQPGPAAERYAAVLAAHPQATWALLRQAIALTHAGREADTIPLYEALLKQNPNHPMILNNLAWIYLTHPDPAQRRPERALKLAEQAVAQEGSIDHWDTLAEAWFQNGEASKAIEVLRQAVRETPFPESRESYLQAQYQRFRSGNPQVPPPAV